MSKAIQEAEPFSMFMKYNFDILRNILSYLAVEELSAASKVCKTWHRVTTDPRVVQDSLQSSEYLFAKQQEGTLESKLMHAVLHRRKLRHIATEFEKYLKGKEDDPFVVRGFLQQLQSEERGNEIRNSNKYVRWSILNKKRASHLEIIRFFSLEPDFVMLTREWHEAIPKLLDVAIERGTKYSPQFAGAHPVVVAFRNGDLVLAKKWMQCLRDPSAVSSFWDEIARSRHKKLNEIDEDLCLKLEIATIWVDHYKRTKSTPFASVIEPHVVKWAVAECSFEFMKLLVDAGAGGNLLEVALKGNSLKKVEYLMMKGHHYVSSPTDCLKSIQDPAIKEYFIQKTSKAPPM